MTAITDIVELIVEADKAEAVRRIESAPERYRDRFEPGARFALVIGRSEREVAAYLPDRYEVLESFEGPILQRRGSKTFVIIGGNDWAGWTLDGYVIPRLHSGAIGATEITVKEEA